ncbi:hypothetical protein BDA96_10G196400 [Sorghum bicolor]|uniref:F-box domain-containing protein n=2 Tax=Sorghum bicolor TaxID=4558 RepID=A0A921Q626_SORBI|nr:uncharacterized protein LOC8073064 [Sorghum bicolor]KAG0514491.1 hypothetical protein BDA96_10G196400 [Sorghum bicolor]KXG20066.1 hypothetical protein SORBI_3010G150200 [Sorghum bicolor]|eukprot:XP_021304747.1 uncharacterized protein LOC8073064 [Sorghum bicolor]
MAAPPAPGEGELTEVLIGEIIHRFPPNNPACLFRASAVSRAWRAFVTSDDVLRRYREFHGAPPVLGLLQNRDPADEPEPPAQVQPRFYATATPPPPINLPNIQGDYSLLLDCRHGRVLVHTIFPHGLIVCNPITGEQQVLPDYHVFPFSCFGGAVLCAVDDCDHLDCHGGAFRVVFTGTINTDAEADEHIDEVFTSAILYSSDTGFWTAPTTVHPGPLMNSNDVMGPSLLAGDAVYFTLDLQNSRTVLRYDLGGAALSVMNAPPSVRTRRDTFLVTGEDEGLGFAAVEDYRLRLWSWSEAVWAPWRDISLETMIPLTIGDPTTELKVIGFAEMSGVIFVMANGIVSALELMSGEISEVRETLNSSTIFPFESFYTPGMGGA